MTAHTRAESAHTSARTQDAHLHVTKGSSRPFLYVWSGGLETYPGRVYRAERRWFVTNPTHPREAATVAICRALPCLASDCSHPGGRRGGCIPGQWAAPAPGQAPTRPTQSGQRWRGVLQPQAWGVRYPAYARWGVTIAQRLRCCSAAKLGATQVVTAPSSPSAARARQGLRKPSSA